MKIHLVKKDRPICARRFSRINSQDWIPAYTVADFLRLQSEGAPVCKNCLTKISEAEDIERLEYHEQKYNIYNIQQ